MQEIEKFIDRLLKPYRNIIDITQMKREMMNGVDNQIDTFHAQGYDQEEIEELIKHSLIKLWHQIEKEIAIDKSQFTKKSRLHFMGYLFLAFIFMIPGVLMGGSFSLPGLMVFLFFICFINYMMVVDHHEMMKINLYLLVKRKWDLWIVWAIYLFINVVVRTTEYGDGTIDFNQYMIDFYLPIATIFIPLALQKIDRIIKKCLKY